MPVDILVSDDKRPLGVALMRGVQCRCPNCGQGKLFRAYLKTVESCEACGEKLSLHRADDLPPYIAITIVGHVLVGAMLHMEIAMPQQPITYLATLLPLALVMPLAMLPSIKGFVVGLQWAQRMHGFKAGAKESDDA